MSLYIRLEDGTYQSSAGNTRGLIEAIDNQSTIVINFQVFRGEYPRPH